MEDLNQRTEAYIESMRQKFLWYFSRKYQGCVAADVLYKVIRNDDALLSIRFEATINAGGSGQYSRSFTLDKRNGKVLELGDLFMEGVDYTDIVSRKVLRQMTEQVETGKATYFIPVYGWPKKSCFQKIDPDQNFYISDQNKLVIVFDEYKVAPGCEDMPEFILPAGVLDGVLRQPSILN